MVCHLPPAHLGASHSYVHRYQTRPDRPDSRYFQELTDQGSLYHIRVMHGIPYLHQYGTIRSYGSEWILLLSDLQLSVHLNLSQYLHPSRQFSFDLSIY